ncbi:uncharacterized protein HaLaN_28619 [Haematococcus lacustris]|uniref:Uncharacterized protein n=1 Tax=Haematococcus lacustris TaxID=44745 RepID=A0A6A0AB27_HAELA|nr:uncharacterized protein HaLaN_28619 [Haematococcus lacustris]
MNDSLDLLGDMTLKARMAQLRFTAHLYSPAELAGVHSDFAHLFYVVGKMTPDGNKNFNLFTTQRFFALHWFMATTNYTDVFHIENDNLVYMNLLRLVPHMHACGVGLTWPYVSATEAVPGFVYLRSAEDLLHLLQYITKIFSMRRKDAIQ